MNRFSTIFRLLIFTIASATVCHATIAQTVFGVQDNGFGDNNLAVGVVDFDFSTSNFTFLGTILDDPIAEKLTLTNFVFEVPSTASTALTYSLTYTAASINIAAGDHTSVLIDGFAVDADGDGIIGEVTVNHAKIAYNSGAAISEASDSVVGASVASGASAMIYDGPNLSTRGASFTGTGNLTLNIRMTVGPGDRLELPTSLIGGTGLVPEPSSLALLSLAGLCMARRRRG